MGITFMEALKNVFSFHSDPNDPSGNHTIENDSSPDSNEESIKDDEQEEQSSKETKDIRRCEHCGEKMELYRSIDTSFLSIVVFHCPNCNNYRELDYEVPSQRVLKTIDLYNTKNQYMYSFTDSSLAPNVNSFSLYQLWDICGCICYPAYVKIGENEAARMVFIQATDHPEKYEAQRAFIVTSNNMIAEIMLGRSSFVYFISNPYLSKIPHPDYIYVSLPTEINPSISTVMNVRYRITKRDFDEDNYWIEMNFVEDFPFHCFGIEVELKFIHKKSLGELSTMDLIHSIHLREIILGESEIQLSEGFYIQSSRVTKVNLFEIATKVIPQDTRNQVYNDILRFVDAIE